MSEALYHALGQAVWEAVAEVDEASEFPIHVINEGYSADPPYVSEEARPEFMACFVEGTPDEACAIAEVVAEQSGRSGHVVRIHAFLISVTLE